MKKIIIKRLPPIALANIMAAYNAAWLVIRTPVDSIYLTTFFGPQAVIANKASTSPILLVYQYVIPVVLAWLAGFLACTAFNAVARRYRTGFKIEAEE